MAPTETELALATAERRLVDAEAGVKSVAARMRTAAGPRAEEVERLWSDLCHYGNVEPLGQRLAALPDDLQTLAIERRAARSERASARRAVEVARLAARAAAAGRSVTEQEAAETLAAAISLANRIPPRYLVERCYGGLVGEHETNPFATRNEILDPHQLGLERVFDPRAWAALGLTPERADWLVRHLRELDTIIAHRDEVLALCHPADDWMPQRPLSAFANGRVPRLPAREPGTWHPDPGTDLYWEQMEWIWRVKGGR